MTEEIVTLQEDDESLNTARVMAETGVRRIPVLATLESLVGLVSLNDAATVIENSHLVSSPRSSICRIPPLWEAES